MIKGVIFDADGTLLDSMHVWDEVGERYLHALGKTPEPDLYRILFPMTLEESSVYLKEHYGLAESPEEIKAGVLAIIDAFYRNEADLKSGVREYLKFLRQSGIRSVVATTGDKDQLEAAFTRLGIREDLEAIFTCSEWQTSKREPKIYLTAAKYLGTQPRETAVFEDVLFAVKTAKGAGFMTVAVEDAANESHREELRHTADLYVGDFTDPLLTEL